MSLRAGYSGKTLAEKLGIKDGHKVAVVNAPDEFQIEGFPAGASLTTLGPDLNVVHFFAIKADDLERHFPSLIAGTVQNGSIWISWPKKSSGVASDLNENIVRNIGLAAGVVDVKVCAVDETWSALKFVRRLEDRKS